MFFAAKAAVERQAMKRGQKEERDRIRKALAERREPITMDELSRILDNEGDNR